MDKEKYTLEFLINASSKIIYNCLTSPSGLSEWFADDVNIRNDIYTFKWDGSEEDARLLNKKRDEFARYIWLADEEEGNDVFFEMRIKIDDLTGELALIITDFAEEDELEEAKMLWESQIDSLKQALGSS
ncbi:START-like domain-containing protein [Halocola ammonii]